ncbi:MAG: CsbD family protein [Thermodesulfobacteriota bacterium]|jgi:uncharacterized protein YjbJ (UPF0337 family)
MEHTEGSMDRSTDRSMMNEDIFAGWWKQKRGMMRSWWGKLTDDDLERIGGQKDKLVGILQERYGYTREMAQREIERRVNEFRDESRGSGWSAGTTAGAGTGAMGSAGQSMGAAAQNVSQSAAGVAENVKAKAQEMGSAVAERASEASSAVGERMSSLASTIRQKAPQEGAMGSAATAVAERLEAAGSYLQESNFNNMINDLTTLIRRYPVQSLLVGLGIGYLLARGSSSRWER